jgi:hypothetical protein
MTTKTSNDAVTFDARRRFRRSTVVIGLVLGICASAGVLVSRSVRAGMKSTQEVYITGPDSTMYATMTAQGSIGSARNSADSVQFIGCDFGMEFTSNNPNYPHRTGGCSARNSAGVLVQCALPDTDNWNTFAAAIATAGPAPYIYFRAIKDQFGQWTCAAMHAYSHSDHMVPVP